MAGLCETPPEGQNRATGQTGTLARTEFQLPVSGGRPESMRTCSGPYRKSTAGNQKVFRWTLIPLAKIGLMLRRSARSARRLPSKTKLKLLAGSLQSTGIA